MIFYFFLYDPILICFFELFFVVSWKWYFDNYNFIINKFLVKFLYIYFIWLDNKFNSKKDIVSKNFEQMNISTALSLLRCRTGVSILLSSHYEHQHRNVVRTLVRCRHNSFYISCLLIVLKHILSTPFFMRTTETGLGLKGIFRGIFSIL